MEFIKTTEMSQEEWVDSRKDYIGGSDVGVILHLSKWKTPHELWQEKKGIKQPKDLSDNPLVQFGKDYEPIIAKKFEKDKGLAVRIDNKIRIHPVYPYMRANIDRLIVKDDEHETSGLLEIKTASSSSIKAWEDEIPVEYYTQIQHYFAITGWTWGYMALYNRDTCQTTYIEIKPDPTLIAEIEKYLVAWWNDYMLGDREPIKVTKDFEVSIPKQGAEIVASDSIVFQIEKLKQLKADLKTREAEVKTIEDEIKTFIGENEILSYDGKAVATWKATASKRLDTDLMKSVDIDTYQKFLKESVSRRFLVK